jgi:hypothetical protein
MSSWKSRSFEALTLSVYPMAEGEVLFPQQKLQTHTVRGSITETTAPFSVQSKVSGFTRMLVKADFHKLPFALSVRFSTFIFLVPDP